MLILLSIAENKLRAAECYKTQRRTGMPVEIGETSSGSWDAKTKKEVSDKHTYNQEPTQVVKSVTIGHRSKQTNHNGPMPLESSSQ